MRYEYLLPVASLLEITGLLTLLTNESLVGPIDFGFKLPYLFSANVQGLTLLIAGGLLTAYTLLQIQE